MKKLATLIRLARREDTCIWFNFMPLPVRFILRDSTFHFSLQICIVFRVIGMPSQWRRSFIHRILKNHKLILIHFSRHFHRYVSCERGRNTVLKFAAQKKFLGSHFCDFFHVLVYSLIAVITFHRIRLWMGGRLSGAPKCKLESWPYPRSTTYYESAGKSSWMPGNTSQCLRAVHLPSAPVPCFLLPMSTTAQWRLVGLQTL